MIVCQPTTLCARAALWWSNTTTVHVKGALLLVDTQTLVWAVQTNVEGVGNDCGPQHCSECKEGD